jgi:aminoglycoside 2'-N-acetyltransferase I
VERRLADNNLKLEILPADQLTADLLAEVLALCNRAYDEDLEELFQTFTNHTHVIARLGDTIVSHAMWVERWLQPGDLPPLRTAYIEMVATEPQLQHHGFGTQVMRRLAAEIQDYSLGCLCTGSPSFYARMGWVFWQGPLFIRTSDGLLPTPEEEVMILKLPKTPPLDLSLPLSAEWREGELW